jgi:hypothetical protein
LYEHSLDHRLPGFGVWGDWTWGPFLQLQEVMQLK